jgi:DNA-binding response OmpR family regulator
MLAPTWAGRSYSDLLIHRRPRLTTSEAMILNALINASNQPVSMGRLRDLITPVSNRFPTRKTVMHHVSNLRAKLGEPKRQPENLLSEVNDEGRVIGYRWRDSEGR